MTHAVQPLDLNLLPNRYRSRPFPWWIAAAILALAGLSAGLVPVYEIYRTQRDTAQFIRGEINALQVALAEGQVGLENFEALDEQITKAQTQLVQIEDQASFLSSQQTPRTHGITAAVEALAWVPNLTLRDITLDGHHLTLAGSAGSQGIVFDYARALQDGGSFVSVQIVRMNDLSDPGALPLVEFVLDAEQ